MASPLFFDPEKIAETIAEPVSISEHGMPEQASTTPFEKNTLSLTSDEAILSRPFRAEIEASASGDVAAAGRSFNR